MFYRLFHFIFRAIGPRELGQWCLKRLRAQIGKVTMTLLKIDRGVDVEPEVGYFHPFDQIRESHTILQRRAVHESTPEMAASLVAVMGGDARPIGTFGHSSDVRGQPRLRSHVRWISGTLQLAAVAWGPR